MKIKILKQTFVKGEFAEAGKVVEASEQDSSILIGSGHGIAVAEDMKKPENKAVKKKSIFSRKKKLRSLIMMTNFKHLFKMAKDNPKISAGIVIVVVVLYILIF